MRYHDTANNKVGWVGYDDLDSLKLKVKNTVPRFQGRLFDNCNSALIIKLHKNASEYDFTSFLRHILKQHFILEDYIHASLQIAWTRLHGFSGFMVWDLDLDDFFNNPQWCAQGRFPLINGMKSEWNNPTVDPCDVICPSGTPNNVPELGCGMV